MSALGWLLFSLQAIFGLCSCADSPSCTALGYAGVCMDTSCCSGGNTTANLCPGQASIQCCTLPTCTTPSGAGWCMVNSVCTGTWGGTPVAGYCNGDSTIQCCVPTSCSSTPGKCVDASRCAGTTLSGQCPGPASIRCCPSGTSAPTPSPLTKAPTPPTSPAGSYKGIDLALTASSTVWSCLQGAGYTYGIVRAWRSNGLADASACGNIQRAHAAGMTSVDIYMFPCPKCSASAAAQVQGMIDALTAAGCSYTSGPQGSSNYGRVWLDVEMGSTYWTTTATNVAFFNGMVSKCNTLGLSCGVYTSASQWSPIMGTSTAGSTMPLWYAHYDSVASFSDFSVFGGWTTPFMKQYKGDQTVCSYGVDINWTPYAQPDNIFGTGALPPLSGPPNTTATTDPTQAEASAASILLPGVALLAIIASS